MPLWPVSLLWVVIDLLVRPSLSMGPARWAWWLGSVVFSVALWQMIFTLSCQLRSHPRLQTASVYATSLVAAALVVVACGFQQLFFSWPTAYAGAHLLRQPHEALGYLVDGVRPVHGAQFVVIAVFIASWWRWRLRQAAPGMSRLAGRLPAVFLLAGAIAFGLVHRFADAMIPDAAGVKLSIDLAVDHLIGGVRGRLMQAHRPPADQVYGGPALPDNAPNVILVIGESLTASHIGLLGYERQTTPRLAAWRQRTPHDWVELKGAIANASATKVSLPTMLTGLFPSRDPIDLHTFPLLWNYAHAAGYQTALISSQSYTWNNLEGFFLDESLDHVFTLEHSDAQIVNAEGLDDAVMVADGMHTIDQFAARGPFFVALQFNCTHYPGYSPSSLRMWPETDVDRTARYDNSIVYMDQQLGRLHDHLVERGLAENTIIVFASDHGEDVDGIHQIHRTDSYYQSTIHIPFFFVIPERYRRQLGERFLRLQENSEVRAALSDLVPTVLDLMGLAGDSQVAGWLARLDGQSLMRHVPADRLLVVVNTDEHVRWSRQGYAVLAGDWKYVFYSWIGPMLFDLSTDPFEQHNLLDDVVPVPSPGGRRHIQRVARLVARTPSLATMGDAIVAPWMKR